MQDMMQDFGRNDVNDGAENRERRELLMRFSLTTFNLLKLVVLAAALAALILL